ncbi:ankyrin-1-like [Leptopilina heterotoma]|uniref:ankyrin-1-like n=1 Tax=Leptopilina heterotoma TaxID=63436 RepID=UPI001CA8068D|nr:ankyrin-1-like [Leptopilina heterotoma]
MSSEDYDNCESPCPYEEEEDYLYDYSDCPIDTPLYNAVYNGDLKAFLLLFDEISLEEREEIRSLLHTAAVRGHSEIVSILCERNFPLNGGDYSGDTPLHLAIRNNHPSVFDVLVRKCNLNATNRVGHAPLHLAAYENYIQFVEILLKKGAKINVQSKNGYTPLHCAIYRKHIQLAEILLQNGANVNVQAKNKQSPLYVAIQIKSIQLAEILLQNGADVNVVDKNETTPLASAAIYNNIELVELLLKNGATISEEQKANKETHEIMMMPLYYAVKNRNYKIVKLLMMNGFNAVDAALHEAVRNNDYEILKYLVEHGSKINAKSKAWLEDEDEKKIKIFWSRTILQSSLSEGSLKIWRYLLKNSSKIDASPNSALHLAVREGQTEVVKKMVKQKDLDTNSIDSRLAVYIAVENGNEEILKILLEAGYSFKTCFRDRSPLHIAATFNHTRLVEMLLNAGADLNTMTEENETCLHFVTAAGQSTVVKFLLEAGIKTTEFYMALEYTLRRGRDFEKLWTLSPLMYKNISNIAEMLIIVEISKTKDLYKLWSSLSYFANKITVPEQNKQKSSLSLPQTEKFILDEIKFKETDKIGKYGNEFLMCILNRLSVFQIKRFSEELMIDITRYDSGKFSSELMHTIFEYNDYRSCFYKNDIKRLFHSNLEDSNISLLMISHIETEYSLHHINWGRNPTDLLKLFAARLFIISRNSYFENDLQFYKKHNLIEWRDECEREVKLMEETEIDNDYCVTFYEILTQSVNKVANYTRNDRLIQIVESSYVRFPAYAEFLKLSVEKGKRRRELIDKCMNFMLNLIKKNNGIQFSTMEINQIFHYLSVVDMRRLLAAFS